MDERTIIGIVRQSIRQYYAELNKKPEKLIEELENNADYLLGLIATVVDSLSGIKRVWIANGVNEKIAAGEQLGGKFNNERLLELAALLEHFEDWFYVPYTVFTDEKGDEVKQLPITVVSRRGNPNPMWASIIENKDVVVPE